MKRTAAMFISLSLAVSTTTFGHGGGLDPNGCHNETATGTRHCHGALNDGGSSSSTAAAGDDMSDVWLILGVASVVGLGFFLVQGRERYTFSPILHADDDGVSDFGFQFKYLF